MKMKNRFALFLTVIMLCASISGCDTAVSNQTSNSTKEPAVEQSDRADSDTLDDTPTVETAPAKESDTSADTQSSKDSDTTIDTTPSNESDTKIDTTPSRDSDTKVDTTPSKEDSTSTDEDGYASYVGEYKQSVDANVTDGYLSISDVSDEISIRFFGAKEWTTTADYSIVDGGKLKVSCEYYVTEAEPDDLLVFTLEHSGEDEIVMTVEESEFPFLAVNDTITFKKY